MHSTHMIFHNNIHDYYCIYNYTHKVFICHKYTLYILCALCKLTTIIQTFKMSMYQHSGYIVEVASLSATSRMVACFHWLCQHHCLHHLHCHWLTKDVPASSCRQNMVHISLVVIIAGVHLRRGAGRSIRPPGLYSVLTPLRFFPFN